MQIQERHRDSAFTLVELLVILALLGVVAWLLLPKLYEARSSSRRAACANNLRQIGVAMLAYAGDHGQHLPTIACNAGGNCNTGSGDGLWDLALITGRYTTANTFVCPDDRYYRPAGKWPRSYALSGGELPDRVKYWIQGSRLTCPNLTPDVILVGERPFDSAGNGAVLGEGPAEWGGSNWFATAHFKIADPATPSSYDRRANYLFVDGRVAWLEGFTSSMFPANPCPGGNCTTPCP